MKKLLFAGLLVLLIGLTGCGQSGPAATGTAGHTPVDPTAITAESPAASDIPTGAPGSTATSAGTETGRTEAAPTGAATPAGPALTPVACSRELTSANQEGPYYSPGSPERSSLLEVGMPGTPILIYGAVFDQDCNPISGARVDFWQADSDGVYDNAGYRLRGHVLTDENGFYAIESIAPGLYTGRPPHIHVKVFSPEGQELLTTQLYFPGSEGSADAGAAPDLLVTYLGQDEQGRQMVPFNFVVPTS